MKCSAAFVIITLKLSLLSTLACANEPTPAWFLKNNVLACDSREHFKDQIAILQQGAYILNDGCGSTTRKVRVVVLELNTFGPSKVKAFEGGPVLWVDKRSLEMASQSTTSVKPSPKSKPVEKKKLEGFPLKNICRAAISMIMYRDVKTMKIAGETASEVRIYYFRNDDNSRWDYKCKFSGNTAQWAAKQPEGWGRWRTEDTIKFAVTDGGKRLSMTVTEGGASTSNKKFNINDFPSR